jgi:hypothetical protein
VQLEAAEQTFHKQESKMGIRMKITTAVACSSLLVTLVTAVAQERKPFANQSPELQVLERFIGSWEETIELRSKEAPQPSMLKIVSTRKWILDGRLIENKGAWSPGNVEFLHLMTYDPKRREYRQWYFDVNNPASMGEDRGHWDEATQTLTWKGKLDDGNTTETIERFTDKDNFTWSFVVKDRSGQVVETIDAKVRRK